MEKIVPYIVVGVLVLLVIAWGIRLRMKQAGSAKKRVYRQAVLLETQREYGEFTDANGVTHRGVVGMTLTFGFRDGSKKSFQADNKMRGRCSENDWGHLMYEGDKLLKFECKSGTIGSKLYVSAKRQPAPPKNEKDA